jgi:hypothetical protein
MKNKITDALTKGLLAGYGGKSQFTKVIRGGFELNSSHFEDNKIVYHDEWTNNGGQEIVKVENEMFTRVYVGGTVEGIVEEKEVITFLIKKIKELGDKTRLFEDYKKENDGDWGYEYKIIDRCDEVSTTIGKETIFYKNKIVFVHFFGLSSIVF